DGALDVAGGYGVAEVVQIADDVRGVEQQAVARRCDGLVAECGAKNVDREIEEAPRARRVLLRPEESEGTVTRERLRPGAGDEGEECDAVALRRRAREGAV